jgi:nitrate reductase (NAD(P)H)
VVVGPLPLRPAAVVHSSYTHASFSLPYRYDPKYIINDLNVNSAIAQPDHNEVLDLKTANETYTMKGYACRSCLFRFMCALSSWIETVLLRSLPDAGGGRRITRVEVSLDDGQTWKLAEIT